MKNLKSNKIIVALAVILMVVMGLTFSVNADNGVQQINPTDVITGSDSTSGNNNANVNANSNANANSNSNKNTNVNSNKNTNSYNNTTNTNTNLPKTGLADYTPLFVGIVTLVGIAVIAYKKVNDYKEI